VASKFKYNGTELEEAFDLNLYEMPLRQYDPAIARWTSIDPVTHYSMSTYTAFDNNPVFWADPSGADSMVNWEGNLGQSASESRANSNWQNSVNQALESNDGDCCGGGGSLLRSTLGTLSNLVAKAVKLISDDEGTDDKEEGKEEKNKALAKLATFSIKKAGKAYDDVYWIGVSKKGKLNVYDRVKFNGNGSVKNYELFKKAGYASFIVITASEYNSLKNDSSTDPRDYVELMSNTTLGAYSFATPHIGTVVFVGSMVKLGVDYVMKQPETMDFLDKLTRDFEIFLDNQDGYGTGVDD
jgi:RHS repeat-associated protein